MRITKADFENKRDSLDCTILAELPQDTKLALAQANLLDSLIEQDVIFAISDYILWSSRFLDDLLSKAHLLGHNLLYKVYVKIHRNRHGLFYNGIKIAPYYTSQTSDAECVGQFYVKG